jgi:hypothetical protein
LSKHGPKEILLAAGVAARLVELHGEEFLPYFEYMEREVAEMRRKSAVLDRARQFSAALHTGGLTLDALGNFLGDNSGHARG